MGQTYSSKEGDILTVNKQSEVQQDEFEKQICERLQGLPGIVAPLIQQQSSVDSIWREMTFASQTQNRSNFVKSFAAMFQCYTEYVQEQVQKAKYNQEVIQDTNVTVQTQGKKS
eukprot:TRINITY_DN4240_c0_g1_i1.p5 TRINITY_DN4240_c0_g1~~TRINITY_DN4240_c0_g1_i1.p5  ORF type:complete len:114 (-),score=17.04 TRINITY_DN4240_c0_g1_i1:825-1166(-)